MRFLEDLPIGERTELGRHTFGVEEIKNFAARFDPCHLDQAAAGTDPGVLRASGWHVACVWMHMLIEHRRHDDEARRARGEVIASLGVSPGFRDLRWPRPVLAGDTIIYATQVVATRISASRPRWGIMTAHNTGHNQRGEPVLEFTSSAFVERRPG